MDETSQNNYYCKKCYHEITKEEMRRNAGLCDKCFWAYDEEDTKVYNKTANIIKTLSGILTFIGILAGLYFLLSSVILGIIIIISSICQYIFAKGFGEIIQLLEDIKNK